MVKRKILFRSHWWKYYCGTRVFGIAFCKDSHGMHTWYYSLVIFGFEWCLYFSKID